MFVKYSVCWAHWAIWPSCAVISWEAFITYKNYVLVWFLADTSALLGS